MTMHLTKDEAQILIAVLLFAEGAALMQAPSITEALTVLQPWRARLIQTYLLAEQNAATDEREELAR